MRSAVLRRLNIFFFSGWSFRQSHPFTWSPSVASPSQLFHWWRGVAEWWDVRVLRVWEFFFVFFLWVIGCPHMCCSASWACSVYTSSFPTHEPKSRCAARCELRCLSREKKLNLWRQTEDRASVSPPNDNIWPVALECYISQSRSINKYKVWRLTSRVPRSCCCYCYFLFCFCSHEVFLDFLCYIPLAYNTVQTTKFCLTCPN